MRARRPPASPWPPSSYLNQLYGLKTLPLVTRYHSQGRLRLARLCHMPIANLHLLLRGSGVRHRGRLVGCEVGAEFVGGAQRRWWRYFLDKDYCGCHRELLRRNVGLSCQFGCFSLTEQNNHPQRDGEGWLAESRWIQPFIITYSSTSYPDPPLFLLGRFLPYRSSTWILLGYVGSRLDLKAYGLAWMAYNLQDGFEARFAAYFMPCIFNHCLI